MQGMAAVSASVAFREPILVARRWELYRAAAPLLDRLGYRGVTVAGLARAALISPAGLYYYFPSKTAFALFPLSTRNGLCQEWHRRQATLPADPIVQLHELISFVAARAPEVRLALRLGREMAADARLAKEVDGAVHQARTDFVELARSIAPDAEEGRATDLFEGLVSVVAADVPGVERNGGLVRQMTDVARGWVTSLGFSAAAFDAAGPISLDEEAAPTVRSA